MRALAFLVALAALSVLAVQYPGHATGTDYYVSGTSGNDDNDGLTPLTPWATIAKVNSVLMGPGCTPCAQPGDTLNLHIGSYWHGTTLELTRSGSPMAPITVQIFGGSGVVPIISGAHPCISITGDYNVVRGVSTINCFGPNWGPEQTIQCLDDLDSDLDGKVNDGCPAIGAGELACSDALDDDADGGFVNDGCPSSGYQPAGVRIDGDSNRLENGSSQGNMTGVYIRRGSDNNRVTGYRILNNRLGDGTPSSGLGLNVHGSNNEIDHNIIQSSYWIDPHDPLGNETGDQCSAGNTADDDADTLVNDGCPVVGSSAEGACSDSLDDDGDGQVNDGCAAAGGGTCRRGNAIEVYGEGGSSASNNNIHHNLSVDNKTFSELGTETAAGGLADGNTYTFNVVRGSLSATICSDASGCPLGVGYKGQSGLVTRGAGDVEHGPVTNTTFNNNTVYLTGDCSQGISCGSSCGDDTITVKNTISVASWKGAFFSGSALPLGVDYDAFREIGTGSGFHCHLSAVGNCPSLPNGLAHGTDPSLVDPANWDLQLKCSDPISIAIDSGTALGYVSDYDGVPIPQDGNHDASAVPDIGAYEMSCAGPGLCPASTPGPGEPAPTPPPTPEPTEFDYLMTFGFTNNTGQAASDLHVCMYGPIGSAGVNSNAPGCSSPSSTHVVRGKEFDVVWPEACVDPGETVTFYVTVPGSGAVHCYFWTLLGVPLTSCAANSDTDGDGWTLAAEDAIGTQPADPCGYLGWPADLVPGGIQPNTLTIEDMASFIVPVRHLDTSSGEPNFDARWDLVPGSTVGKQINIADLASLVTGATAYPPMFNGQRAWGRTCPYDPGPG